MKALILPFFLLFQAPNAPTSSAQTPIPSATPTPGAPAAIEANATPADESSTPIETPAPLETWPGTVAEAFAAIEKHAYEKQFESARLIADRLLAPNAFLRWKSEQEAQGGWRKGFVRAAQPTIDWLALDGLDSDAHGEVWFARGVVDSLAQLRPDAENDFQAARAASSDRTLQNDAIYDIGVLALEEGEEIRATLPEISGKPPTAQLPVPPAPGAATAQQAPPDPLQLARAAYSKAREHFVERLKSDWRDDDTRANVELCLKRLKELDLIEKKREEEKQKQEEQQKKDQDQKQDQKDKDQQKPDDQKSEKDPSKKDDKGDSKDDPKPQEPQPEDPQKPDEKPADEKKDPAEANPKKDAPPVDPKDAQMSHEEMTQLLDRLKQLEDDAKKIQAQLKAARRGKVKKDW